MKLRPIVPIIAVLALSLLPGCVTMKSIYGPIDLSRAEDPSLRAPVGELALAPALEPYGVRADIWRVIVSSSDGKGHSSSNPAEYAPIGVSLGQGIIVDANFNVCVDILGYFGAADQDFSYDQRMSFGRVGNLKSFTLIERRGNASSRLQSAGFMKIKYTTTRDGGRIETKGPMFSQEIEAGDGRLALEQRIQLFTFKSAVEAKGADRVEFQPLALNGKGTFVLEGPGRVTFGDRLAVERLSDRIRLTANRFMQAQGVVDFIPAKEGFFIVDEKRGLVTEVRREDGDYRFYVNGKLAADYKRVK